MPSPLDLITPADAVRTIGTPPQASLAPFIPNWITDGSIWVKKWLRRNIVATNYDELRSPLPGQPYRNDPPRIELRQFPLIPGSIRLQGGRTGVLAVYNADATTNQRATAQILTTGDRELCLTPIGLQLQRVASAVPVTNTFFWGGPSSWGFTATVATGGSLAAGAYLASYSVVSIDGMESPRSADLPITVPASGEAVFGFPEIPAYALGYNLYLSTANGNTATETRQNGGTPISAAGLGLNVPLTFTVTTLAAGSAPVSPTSQTIAALQGNIVALGAGWNALVPVAAAGYQPALFASADLIAPFSPLGCLSNSAYSNTTVSGALLSIFVDDLVIVELDEESGEVMIGTSGFGSAGGVGSSAPWGYLSATMADSIGGPWSAPVRARYQAGWRLIPEPIRQAVAVLVQQDYENALAPPVFKSQKFGNVSYEVNPVDALPKVALAKLSMYRRLD